MKFSAAKRIFFLFIFFTGIVCQAIAQTPHSVDTTDPSSLWYNSYYPALFSTKDPENANKAVKFLNSHTSFKNFNNYTFIAYAFERNGDFQQAKENYELANSLKSNDREEYHSYLYYTNFLARTGDYLKAEEYIRRMETLSEQAADLFKASYRAEAMSAKVVYFLSIGDYHSYIKAATDQYDYITRINTYKYECDPYPGIRFTTLAFAKEMLKEYGAAESLWKSRDS